MANKETFEIKDLKIGQQGTYKQFLGNSIDDGRRLLFISFDNDYCAVVTDTEWHSKKEGNLRQLKVTDLFISKQLHDTEIQKIKDECDKFVKLEIKDNEQEHIDLIKQHTIELKEKDKVISLRNIEITQRKQDYKELQAEIKHEKETSCLAIMKVEDDKKKLKEMQKSLLCSIGNIRGNLANYQINHNEQQLNDIYEICNENLN